MVEAFRIVCIISLIFIGSLGFSKSHVISKRSLETAENGQNTYQRFNPIAGINGLVMGTEQFMDSMVKAFTGPLLQPMLPQLAKSQQSGAPDSTKTEETGKEQTEESKKKETADPKVSEESSKTENETMKKSLMSTLIDKQLEITTAEKNILKYILPIAQLILA